MGKFIQDKTPDQLKLPYALWTRAAVAQLIEERLGIKLAVRTIGKYLARWGFTPQKPMRKAYAPVKLLEQRNGTPDKDLHRRGEAIYKQLQPRNHLRAVAFPRAIERRLDQLAQAQPHYHEVIAFVRSHLRLARRTGRAPRIPAW